MIGRQRLACLRRVKHLIHFWRHRDLHASRCVCKGTGRLHAARPERTRT